MCVIDWVMLLEYFKVLLGWPVVTGTIVFIFMRNFSSAIATKLAGLLEVGYPGGIAKFDPAASQGAAAGDALASLELPKGSPNAQAGVSKVNKQIADRTRWLLTDAGDSPPHLDAALEHVQANPGPTVDMYVESLFRHHCERTFAAIFGGQLLALEYIIAKGAEALVPHSDLDGFIRVHAEKAAAASQTPLTGSQFVGFLKRNYLIRDIGQSDNPAYRGTFTGQQFLVYIKEAYPLGWHTRAL